MQTLIPEMVIIGGYARFKMGIESHYTKSWIDVKVESVEHLRILQTMGRLTQHYSDFQSSVTHRYTWKGKDNFTLDIFVEPRARKFIIIDKLNLQPIEEGIKFYQEYLEEMGDNPYIEGKLTKLQSYI